MMWEDYMYRIEPIAILSHFSIDSVAFTGELRGNLPIGTLSMIFAIHTRLHFEGIIVDREAAMIQWSGVCV
jgi:hypothetical protein